MKREIKLRVKLKNEHSFRDAYGINLLNYTAMVLIGGQYEWIEYKDIVQFTGLSDKNGKEIYEKDKVFIENAFNGSDPDVEGIIRYSDCNYYVDESGDADGLGLELGIWIKDKIEVIKQSKKYPRYKMTKDTPSKSAEKRNIINCKII